MDKIRKHYSNKMVAIHNGRLYAEQEKQTIYLHESRIDLDQYQYSWRFASELIDVNTDNVTRRWEYHSDGRITHAMFKRRVRRTASIEDTNLPMGAQDHPDAPFND